MQHATTRLRMLSIGVVAVLGFAACGSDEDSSSDDTTAASASAAASESTATPDVSNSDSDTGGSIDDASTPEITLPPGVTVPDGVSIPSAAELGEQCTAYYNLFASAFTGDSEAVSGLDDAVDELQAEVPDDLQDDVEVVGEAISKLVELSEQYQGNPTGLYSDPEALALFGDPAFVDSQQKVTAWLQTECGTGS